MILQTEIIFSKTKTVKSGIILHFAKLFIVCLNRRQLNSYICIQSAVSPQATKALKHSAVYF